MFCGSNLIKIYESFFKLPITHIFFLNLSNSIEINNILIFNQNIDLFKIEPTDSIEFNENLIYYSTTMSNTIQGNEFRNSIFLIHFDTLTTQKSKIEFEILQNKIYICPGESSLAFFRITNLNDFLIRAFSIYVVTPSEYTPFINKLQCFCYEELLLYPHETVDLPVLFRLEQDVLRLENFNKELVIEYIIVF